MGEADRLVEVDAKTWFRRHLHVAIDDGKLGCELIPPGNVVGKVLEDETIGNGGEEVDRGSLGNGPV